MTDYAPGVKNLYSCLQGFNGQMYDWHMHDSDWYKGAECSDEDIYFYLYLLIYFRDIAHQSTVKLLVSQS